jgi:N-acetyl-1-D-myo-inositol-2-amino-2-deoxy-alpha-D-glucopyranoside deacetylase
MMGMESNDDPRCFWRASLDEAAAQLAEIIREVAPQAIVTYDANGFYGHPDHIQAHRVTSRAHSLAAPRARLFATAMPASAAAEAARLPPGSWFTRAADPLADTVPDNEVTTTIDATAYLDAKLTAMTAHATQVTVDGEFFALSNNIGRRVLATEYFIQLAGPPGSPDDLL